MTTEELMTSKFLFDVVDIAKGYSHESEKRQERERKKEFNPHSQVCHAIVTFSEVHNGLRDKGQISVCPLLPGEQYSDCDLLIPMER